jgi:hypothetical protein
LSVIGVLDGEREFEYLALEARPLAKRYMVKGLQSRLVLKEKMQVESERQTVNYKSRSIEGSRRRRRRRRRRGFR